jgi:hypothetical protein
MAAVFVVAFVAGVTGAVLGAYWKICSAIRREDRKKWSLRRAAPDQSAQSARDFVGISSSKWN